MKTILISILLLTVSFFATAQLTSNELTAEVTSNMKITAPLSQSEITVIAERQNRIVTREIQTYFKEQLNYSETMKENCMEGEVLVQVNISEAGIITNYKIVNSPKTEMDAVVMKMMEGLKTLKLGESRYYGYKKIRIPVDFSIR